MNTAVAINYLTDAKLTIYLHSSGLKTAGSSHFNVSKRLSVSVVLQVTQFYCVTGFLISHKVNES